VDFKTGRISFNDQVFKFSPLSATAQELVVAGGVENLVRSQLK
jgi:hypothetical protein